VLTANTGAVVRATSAWFYQVRGTIQTVNPTSGAGGTEVVISGTDLCGNGTEIVNVTLAGFAATIVTSLCGSFIRVTARNYGAPITGDVVLIADTGAQVSISNA
jgi:hypothetical protein